MSAYELQPDGTLRKVTDPPTRVDLVQVVRCRDCKYYEPNTYSHFTCELLTFHVEPDGFCAWGERRES